MFIKSLCSVALIMVFAQSCGTKSEPKSSDPGSDKPGATTAQSGSSSATTGEDSFVLKGETFFFKFSEFRCGDESAGAEVPELKGTTLKQLQASRSESVLWLDFVPRDNPAAACQYAARYENDVANSQIVRAKSKVTAVPPSAQCNLAFEAMTKTLPFKLAPDRKWVSLTVLPQSPTCKDKPLNAFFVFDRVGE